jgi:hypothetical protein
MCAIAEATVLGESHRSVCRVTDRFVARGRMACDPCDRAGSSAPIPSMCVAVSSCQPRPSHVSRALRSAWPSAKRYTVTAVVYGDSLRKNVMVQRLLVGAVDGAKPSPSGETNHSVRAGNTSAQLEEGNENDCDEYRFWRSCYSHCNRYDGESRGPTHHDCDRERDGVPDSRSICERANESAVGGWRQATETSLAPRRGQ